MITLDVTTTFVFSLAVLLFGGIALNLLYKSYKLTLNGNSFFERFVKSRAIFGFMEAATYFIFLSILIFNMRPVPDILDIPFAIIFFGAGYNHYYSAKKELESQTWDKYDYVKFNTKLDQYGFTIIFIIAGLAMLGFFNLFE